MSSSVSEQADVAVLGAGPAGSAAALGLARRGFRVVLIDRGVRPPALMGESLRALSQEPLRALGLWEDFLRQGYKPSYFTRAFWAGQVLEKDSIRHRHGPDYHLDRHHFDAWLTAHACSAGVRVFTPARVSSLTRLGEDGFALEGSLAGARLSIAAHTLIDATGRSAWAMRQLGAQRSRVDRLVGRARWFHAPSTTAEVLVEAADHGWWYSAPLPNSRLVALHFTDADAEPTHAISGNADREWEWESSLASAPQTRARLGDMPSEQRATFAATPQITDYDPDARCFPVGDAAFCFDPLAAWGLWFALASAHDVVKVIANERTGGGNLRRAYRDSVQQYFRAHLLTRQQQYAAEGQRRGTPFWQRKRGQASTVTPPHQF
jgi:flavin-dependent dehydrogenase